MFRLFKKELLFKILSSLFVILFVFWLYTILFEPEGSPSHDLFTNIYGVIALFGGVSGLIISRKWGGFKSFMGKAIIFFSFGLLFQVFGQLSYNYYIYVLNIDAPYPSIGDIGFFGYMPMYLLGMYFLARSAGVKIGLKSFSNQLLAILFPLVLLGASYFIFLQEYQVDFSYPLITFLDFGYPLFQAFNVSIALLVYQLTSKSLGGVMRPKVLFFVVAFISQYVADFTFLFMISRGTPPAVGGFTDFLYMFSYFLMVLALIQLKTVADDLEVKKSKK